MDLFTFFYITIQSCQHLLLKVSNRLSMAKIFVVLVLGNFVDIDSDFTVTVANVDLTGVVLL